MLILFACGKKVSDIKDFNKEIYTPEYASGFKILGTDDSGSVIINGQDERRRKSGNITVRK